MLKEYQFSENLKQLIIESNLSINSIYWVLKDTFNEIEKLYMEQIQKELKLQEEIKNVDDFHELDNE